MKISYIISSIGNSKKLKILIDQIIKNLSNNELILIDNSKDKKLEKEYMNYKNLKYIHENVSGLSAARNRGAYEACNELLVFLDDDIILNDDSFAIINNYSNTKLDQLIGCKIIPNSIPNYLPQKYLYLVGKKDYGNEKIILSKYKYLGGCLLILSKSNFKKTGGFNEKFGHNGKRLGANEDVIFQDILRSNRIDVVYDPKIEVKHYWNGNYESIIKRVKIQGISDRFVDLKYHKIRFLLKIIKYKLFMFLKKNSSDLNDKFDIMRYKSYVTNKD